MDQNYDINDLLDTIVSVYMLMLKRIRKNNEHQLNYSSEQKNLKLEHIEHL